MSQPRSDRVEAKTWLAVGASIIGAFMAVLNIQITNASLPDIQGAIGEASMMADGFPPPIWSRRSWSSR
jgi:hypothetical protein